MLPCLMAWPAGLLMKHQLQHLPAPCSRADWNQSHFSHPCSGRRWAVGRGSHRCDTYSFNYLHCHATHRVAPDFNSICLTNFRQWESLNAHKFVHTVQGRKIPEMGRTSCCLQLPDWKIHRRWSQTSLGDGWHQANRQWTLVETWETPFR